MRISVNRKLNVAYVRLQDEPDTVETKRLSEDLLVEGLQAVQVFRAEGEALGPGRDFVPHPSSQLRVVAHSAGHSAPGRLEDPGS